jgi:hypothetical protein
MTTESAMIKKIKVPIRTDDRGPSAVEALDVEELGPNRYRLLYSPGLVEGLAAGDEFELVTVGPLGYRVLSRAGNVVVWFFFPVEGQNQGPLADSIKQSVEAIGGKLDGGGRTNLVFTIPVGVGFGRIEGVVQRAVKEIPGSTWMYGNVYDPVDGVTPLNWWTS